MRKINLAVFMALTPFLFSSCSSFNRHQGGTSQALVTPAQELAQQQEIAMQAKLDQFVAGWPTQARLAAKQTIEKYGDPVETTYSMLIWKNVAPFKRIIVYREELTHRFPLLHMDVIEHVVDFKVPADKMDDLANFDGSVKADITAGELSARSDQEAMNMLALNLASEIISGDLRAGQARVEFGKRSMEFMNGVKGNYTESLLFGRQISTVNADQSISNKIRWVQSQEDTPRRKLAVRKAPVPLKKDMRLTTPPPMRQAQQE